MSNRRNYFRHIVAATFALGLLGSLAFARLQNQPPERFDYLVREDFFAGFAGDHEALARGMKNCEEKLKAEPENPEALVWHGSGLMFESGQRFRNQDFEGGMELMKKGEAEMDRAVALQPKNISVLIPRAACLIVYSRFVRNPEQEKSLLARVVSDYEEVYRQQQDGLARLSSHSRGELLFGLAEAYLRTGGEENRHKAFKLLETVRKTDAGTGYATEAVTWMKAPKDAPAKTFTHTCTGCHVSK